VRAVENALGISIPDNARIVRNLLEGAQFIHDHVIHFYHLHGPDWVDVVDALSADPVATSNLARSVSDWPQSSPEHFEGVRDRLQTYVDSGQLGIFANGYWGHPSYRLPSEANLLVLAHYLEALNWQREVIKIHAILGGKSPHPQTYLVGGMAMPVDRDSPDAINPGRIAQLRSLAAQALDFASKVLLPDLLLVASFYDEWAGLGAGPGSYMSVGDFPTDTSAHPSALWLPRGVVFGNDIASPPEPLDQLRISEYATHSWYTYPAPDSALHPSEGMTQPNYTGPEPPYEFLNTDAKYSWLKAPRYDNAPMEVGPLARMLVAYAAGHMRVRQEVNRVLATLGHDVSSLFSTLGRVTARGIETLLIAEQLSSWIDELEDSMNGGQLAIHNGERWHPSTWPTEARGWGTTEAPRGALGHWIHILNGQIQHYQAVVPTTWNGSPRDAQGRRGPWEEALIGTPVADLERPVEILRTIHSFDPCMACAVHVVDARTPKCIQIAIT
jgi:hydrogenase large subunit